MQEDSQEMWGGTPRFGFTPTVQAHFGPLSEGVRGVEFYSFTEPYSWDSPYAHWYSGHPGVRTEDDYAKISCVVTRNTQC